MTEIQHDVLTGSCLCGAVAFELDAPFRDILICHCTQCAKWTGHQVAATAVDTGKLRIVAGGDALTWFSSSDTAERGFCGTCGSSLFWRPTSATHISIMAGTIDDPTGLTVGAHICTADQRGYVASAKTAPTFPGAQPCPATAGDD